MRTLVAAALALAATAPALQDADFAQAFRAAMKTGDKARMQAVVEEDQEGAVLHAVDLCEQISRRPTPDLEEEVDLLRIAYKRAFDSGFVGQMYEYLSLLSPSLKKQREVARTRYLEADRRLAQAEANGKPEDFGVAAHEFEGLAPLFDSLGDPYFSSQCWLKLAHCFEEDVRGEKDADLKRAAEAYTGAIAMREKAGLKDGILERAKKRFDELEFRGYGDPSKGPAAREAEKRAAESANAMALVGSFQVVADIDDFQRPTYTGDSVYQIWKPVIVSGEEGATAPFPGVEGLSVVRTAAAAASVDGNGDGQPDAEVPMTGNIAPVNVTIGQGPARRPWAFLACIGKERDIYQGYPYNMISSGREYVQFFVAPAASMVVMVGEIPVQILDDNMDGVYGSDQSWSNEYGLRDNSFEPHVDSVRIDEDSVAVPWSEVIHVGDAWYRFESVNGGKEFVVTPTTLETGKIELDFKGPKPDWLIVKGADESNQKYMFDLAPGGKRGTEVPVGRYELLFGRVSKGKRDQMAKAIILPGKESPKWTVTAGGEVTIEMGQPFGFDFDVEQSVATFKVPGKSLVITGRGGETYQRFWNCVPQPDVSARAVGKKKGDDEGKMRTAGSQEEIVSKDNDVGFAWVPYDFEMDKKRAGEEVEVQLAERKNKLFGKVESDWKK